MGTWGVCVLAALGMNYLIEKKKAAEIVYIVFGLLIVILTVRTIVRNNDWKTQDNLWLSAAEISRYSSQNHNNLGDMYGRRGDLEMAAKEFMTAIEISPQYAHAYHNLGNVFHRMKRAEDAEKAYLKAVEINRGLWETRELLGIMYFHFTKWKL